ncbi:glycosyltransferase [Billgrantia sp. Q4P2]|uniref:glycosyltransferase n=1 Tax=Billgrantia sp. Q4P2 TaxID=3463857 RepID=UPI004055AAE8
MKLLFTAGTQFDFPRLQQAVEQVARQRPQWQLTFQAGPGARLEGLAEWPNVLARPLFPSVEFQALFDAADLVVTHAGMGNIIACLEAGKPLMMLPRRAGLGEHRNDHQIDTAEAFLRMYNVPAYESVPQLVSAIVEPADWPQGGTSAAERIHRTRSAFARQFDALLREL